MWYTKTRAEEGPVFGSTDNWNGLGIFFDSFDNDGLHNNPYVSVMLNDGTKSYDHDTYVYFSCVNDDMLKVNSLCFDTRKCFSLCIVQ